MTGLQVPSLGPAKKGREGDGQTDRARSGEQPASESLWRQTRNSVAFFA